MATEKLVTQYFNVDNARKFVGTFAAGDANSNYYIYASRHIPYDAGDSNVPALSDSVQDVSIDVYDNMVFSKRVLESDVAHMIHRYDWTSGTVYSEYTHENDTYLGEQYYVVINEATEYNVYKCLFNNSNAVSTVPPSRVGSPADLDTIITGDGYYWKYMYTITKTQYEKFASTEYIPLFANSDVIDNAVEGTVEVIKIVDGGTGYDNFIVDTFGSGDIKFNASTITYRLGDNASTSDDFYKGCVMRITSGTALDQYRRIIASIGVGADKLVTLDAPFPVEPEEGDSYEIYPYVYVWGDGNETVEADGIAIVDEEASNSISQIEILNPGAGYRYGYVLPGTFPALSVNTSIEMALVVSADESFRAANLVPIISPPGGHGSDPYAELQGKFVCISTRFNDSESGNIPTENDFRQIGLIKDPKFHNVDILIQTSNTNGSFSVGETVYQFKQLILSGNVALTSGNNLVTKSNQGVISTNVVILNAGTRYDTLSNNQLVFNNTGTGGSGAAATFTANATFSSTTNFRANNAVTGNFISVSPNQFTDGQRVRYWVDGFTDTISGLSNNENYFVVSANASGLKLSTTLSGTEIAIANSSGSSNSNLSLVNGAILTVTVTNQGNGYASAPTATVNPTAGAAAANAQFTISLANPDVTAFADAYDIGDYILITKSGLDNFLSTVEAINNDYQLTAASNAEYTTSDAKLSALKLGASGVVTSVSTGQITLSNVSGIFTEGSKIVGTSSGATSKIDVTDGIEVNDKDPNGFRTAVQLTRLVGNIGASAIGFSEDEEIKQDTAIEISQPSGYLHHIDLNNGVNDDVLYISNEYGVFNTISSTLRDVIGQTTGASLTDLTTKYPGDFVKGSGRVLYYENIPPVTRSGNKSEILKIILEF